MRISSILPAGQQIGTQFYSPNATYHDFSSFGALIAESITALNKAPNWLCYELRNILTQLSPEKQLVWAGLINSTQDPFVDEIAFCIAHSSVEYLSSDFALPELFTENAEVLYAIDSELSYVQIVDYGTSATDREFYSTTRYQKYNSAGDLVQMDVPRDIYYWYLVHPKLTDEIPAYIDPAIIENNSSHNNNISPPPTGVFWRSFLYEAQEENYPVLADTLRQIQTLFNHNGDTSDAIHAIGWWINNTMSFTSNSERPHQPVRIYRKHIGRCGEYADYTSAASRTALIPCNSILSMSTDHTWNEFWDEDWIMWEPVNGYINNPFVYENGWGKVFGSVFEIRSDGVLSSVTERYSEGLAHINICFTDENQTPIDGARVILAFYE
ncbi:MAG: transglutaminase domain-containing protein, partial [Candidatus Cloacimonetes bacterium]|nr:transglutaminase domain-containing protein [Candidatus Cloacimonadota bacterium]